MNDPSPSSAPPQSAAKTPERKPKRRKTTTAAAEYDDGKPSPSRWRSPAQQRIYSSNLLHAVRRVRRSDTGAPRSRAVREAADRALAAAARGADAVEPRDPALPPEEPEDPEREEKAAGSGQAEADGSEGEGAGTACSRMQEDLLPSLLDEATDYIAALQMQVKAMSALADLLSSVENSSRSH